MLYSRQLFGVGSRIQAKVRLPEGADQAEHTAFSFGLQSVVSRHMVSDTQEPIYNDNMDFVNKHDVDRDIFCVRFSLNAC